MTHSKNEGRSKSSPTVQTTTQKDDPFGSKFRDDGIHQVHVRVRSPRLQVRTPQGRASPKGSQADARGSMSSDLGLRNPCNSRYRPGQHPLSFSRQQRRPCCRAKNDAADLEHPNSIQAISTCRDRALRQSNQACQVSDWSSVQPTQARMLGQRAAQSFEFLPIHYPRMISSAARGRALFPASLPAGASLPLLLAAARYHAYPPPRSGMRSTSLKRPG